MGCQSKHISVGHSTLSPRSKTGEAVLLQEDGGRLQGAVGIQHAEADEAQADVEEEEGEDVADETRGGQHGGDRLMGEWCSQLDCTCAMVECPGWGANDGLGLQFGGLRSTGLFGLMVRLTH